MWVFFMGKFEMSLTALQQQVGEIKDEILSFNEQLSDPTLSDDAKSEADRQIASLMPRLELAESRAKREATLLAKVNGDTKPRKTQELQADLETEKPKPIIPAQARRIRVEHFINETIDGKTPEERAHLFGLWGFAAAAKTNHRLAGMFDKYRQRYEELRGPVDPVKAAATESGNAGVFVPDEATLDLVTEMKKYGLARQLANVVQMTRETRTDIKEGSDPAPSFTPELAAASDVTPTDDAKIQLTAKKLYAYLLWSNEVQDDAVAAFGDSMMRRFANGYATKEDDVFFNGDGSAGDGGIIGIRTKLTSIDGAGTDSFGLTTGTGTTWASLVLGDFRKTKARFPLYANNMENEVPNGVWVVSPVFWDEVMMKLLDAAGGNTTAMLMSGAPLAFMGHRVRLTNSFETETGTNELCALFGDFRRAVQFGDRRSFSVDFSTEATVAGVNLFEQDAFAARGIERLDINFHSPGTATVAGPVVALQTGV